MSEHAACNLEKDLEAGEGQKCVLQGSRQHIVRSSSSISGGREIIWEMEGPVPVYLPLSTLSI